MKLVVVAAVAAGLASGCTGAASSSTSELVATGGASAPAAAPVNSAALGKHVVQGSGKLAITIAPTSGPVGTVVEIRGTFCRDPNGENHAVSFNPDTTLPAMDQRGDHIQDTLVGEKLTAHYTITAADAQGSGHGRFYVQCATDLADRPFTITK